MHTNSLGIINYIYIQLFMLEFVFIKKNMKIIITIILTLNTTILVSQKCTPTNIHLT